MDPEQWLEPEALQMAERLREIEAEIAEIKSEIEARQDNPLEVEPLLRRLNYLERRKDALGRQRPDRILTFQQRRKSKAA